MRYCSGVSCLRHSSLVLMILSAMSSVSPWSLVVASSLAARFVLNRYMLGNSYSEVPYRRDEDFAVNTVSGVHAEKNAFGAKGQFFFDSQPAEKLHPQISMIMCSRRVGYLLRTSPYLFGLQPWRSGGSPPV